VRIVNPKPRKFFGFAPVDVLAYKVMMSDREKTAIDCIDRPALAGRVGEAVLILATPGTHKIGCLIASSDKIIRGAYSNEQPHA
jgi:hypothetical protein